MGGTPTRALALVAVLVLALLAPVGPAVATSTSSTSSAPSGMVGVPDGNVDSDLPPNTPMGEVAEELRGQVMASSNASTLDVIVTSPGRADKYTDGSVVGGGPIAVVFRDDVNHAGRDVALPASTLRDVLGYLPETAYGTHEDGSRWTRETRVEDGYLVWEVPHFSTQTVTFSGSVELGGSSAVDGTSYEYELGDLAATTDPVVNLTGVLNTEWDNETASGVGLSSTQSVSLDGTSVAGPDGGSPTLEVTGHSMSASYNTFGALGLSYDRDFTVAGDYSDDHAYSHEAQITPDFSGPLDNITVDVSYTRGSDYDPDVSVYIVEESIDGNYREGTKVATWDPVWSSGEQTIPVSGYSVEANQTYSIEFVTESTDNDGTWDAIQLGTSDNTEKRVSRDGTISSRTYDITLNSETSVDNLSVSTDTGESATFGSLANGETASATLDVSTSTSSLSWSGDGGGNIDYTLAVEERTQTTDAGIELNNQTEVVAGVLADGESTEFTVPKEWLVEGTNRVNVTVGDGTLSADAPAPSVDLAYSHDATSELTSEASETKWSVAYNTSKTWASDRNDAAVTIPFAEDVVSVRNVEVLRNGSAVDRPTSFENGTLVAELGTVEAGTEWRVKATGSRIQVVNGSLTVTDPTTSGNVLDTEVRLDSWSSSSAIDVSGLAADRTHYLAGASWEDPAPYVEVDQNGHERIRMPGASAGSTTRVRTMPLNVRPESGTVEVLIEDSAEPRFRIRPASPSPGDVLVEWRDVVTGETYELIAVTEQDEPYGSDGSSDGVVSVRTDSQNRVYTFQIKESSSGAAVGGTGGEDGSGGGWGPLTILSMFGGLTASLVGTFWVGRRLGASGWRQNLLLVVVGGVVGVVGAEAVTSRSIVASITYALGDAAGGFAASGVGAVVLGSVFLLAVYAVYRRWSWVPRLGVILATGGTSLWVLDAIFPGALQGGLSTVSPLLWVLAGLGALIAIYVVLRGRPVVLQTDSGGNS